MKTEKYPKRSPENSIIFSCIFHTFFIIRELQRLSSEVRFFAFPEQDLLSKHTSRDSVSYVIIIFMAKKPTKVVKLQLKAGQANPAPPVGTALGPTGIQIAEFCKQFNDKTKDQMGKVLPTVINIYEDRSFDFYTKQPPMTWWIKDALKLASGSKEAHKTKVGHLTMAQLKTIAEGKMPDLNANDVDMAMSIVAGSARSMGIKVVD